jgi:protein O-mannosyl-transferase
VQAPQFKRASKPLGGQHQLKVVVSLLVLFTALILAYLNSFKGVWVLDDHGTFAENPTLTSLIASLSPPHNGTPIAGRPITNFSFALNRALLGESLLALHVGNFTIHLLAAFCLYGILRYTLIKLSAATIDQCNFFAVVVTLLWAVHPLNTESVTYLSQRAESLMGLFYLFTLYAFIRYSSTNSLFWCMLSLGACLLGMGTKEVMVTAPFIIFVYDWFFVGKNFSEIVAKRKTYYLLLVLTWIALAVLVTGSGDRAGTAGFSSSVSWWAYAFTQIKALGIYLKLAIWPAGLIADYGRILGGSGFEIFFSLFVLVLLLGATLILTFRRSPWGFCGIWFFVILSPSSSFVPVSTEIIAEHRMYLPLVGVIVGVTSLIYFFIKRFTRNSILNFFLISILSFSAITALVATTYNRNTVYLSVLNFWKDVALKAPYNAGALNNYGNALAEIGDLKNAEIMYKESIKLVPAYMDANVDLGNLLVREGRIDEAVTCYHVAISTPPTSIFERKALGNVAYRAANALLDHGRHSESLEFYRVATQMQPNLVDARVNYGGVLAELGYYSEAAVQFKEAIHLEPNSADIHNNLGGVYAQMGRMVEAKKEFETALNLKPGYHEALRNLEQVNRILANSNQ